MIALVFLMRVALEFFAFSGLQLVLKLHIPWDIVRREDVPDVYQPLFVYQYAISLVKKGPVALFFLNVNKIQLIWLVKYVPPWCLFFLFFTACDCLESLVFQKTNVLYQVLVVQMNLFPLDIPFVPIYYKILIGCNRI